ncbi:MAG: serine hydrolase domain-containing protein [Bacteroidota bacterium]
MTKQFIIILLALFLLGLGTDTHAQNEFAEIEQLIDTYVQTHDIPAISIGIVKDGTTTYINRGTYARDNQRPVDEHALYQIASVSKTFTGAIVNQLIIDKKMDINESIITYLPDDYDDKIKRKFSEVTIQHVLRHRSGLPRDSKVTRNMRKGNDPLIYNYTEDGFRTDLSRMRLQSTPGVKFSYSNFGYALLGYIAERVSGQSYDELLQQYITDPYHLDKTSTIAATDYLVTPYRKEDRKVPTTAFVLGKLTPPSGIYSNTYDLTQLMQAQLKAYISEDESNRLYLSSYKRSYTDGDYHYGIFQYGDGTYGHGGDIDGFASDYWFRPKEQIGCALLTSSGGPWVQEFAVELNKQLTALARKEMTEVSDK